jgi:hypothetical protein
VKEELQEGLDLSVLTDTEKLDKQRRMLLQKYGVIPPQPISKRQMRSMGRRWKEKNDV